MAVIRVQVEQLTLTGVRRGQRDRVVAEFQRELTRLLTAEGLPGAGIAAGAGAGVRERVAGTDPLPPTRDPRRLGRRLARSVHAALSAAGPGREAVR